VILSALLTIIPLTIAWIYHQFVTGLNPFLAYILMPLVLIMAIFIYRLLFKTFKKYISFTPDVLFAMGLFSYVILTSILFSHYSNSVIDIHLHDTYFVISQPYPVFFIVVVFAMFAAIYHWFFRISGREMNNTLGYIHFWATFIGTWFFLLPVQYEGLAGMPRRYYDYGDGNYFNTFYDQNHFMSIMALLLLIAQLLFVFNFCNSIFRRSK